MIIRTVSALLYRRNKQSQLEILLHKHKFLTENGEPVWLGVGGKVESDEHESEALVREVFEESGIWLVNDILDGVQYDRQRFSILKPSYITRINLDNGNIMFDHVYEIEITHSDNKLCPETDEMKLDWYNVFEALRSFNMYSDTNYQIWQIVKKYSNGILKPYYEKQA